MNKDLQAILDFIQQSGHLSDEEKKSISKSLKDANKELEITSFKLERTEKVKHTTAILLEETIEELEQKRKAVEAQNKELEIESSLERVRTVALSMNKPDDMLRVCRIIAEQLELLKVKEIRNVQTAIFYKEKGMYMNYEYYAKHKKTFITETTYTNHEIHEAFAEKMLKGNGEFYITHIKGDEVKDWIAYQKTTNVFIDDYLYTASSLSYYWFSLGPVALGISTYIPLTDDETNLFRRFLKVFELSYRRYLDIEKAEAQAREAMIEASLERVRAQAMSMRKSEELAAVGAIIFEQLKLLGFSDLRNTEIIINNDTKESIFSYYYSDYGITGTIEVFYKTNPTVQHWVQELKKANDAFVAIEISENEMDAWRKYREEIGYMSDPKLNEAKSVFYYSYSTGLGALSISSFTKISDEQIKTLERFRNVFGLAYRRYADVAQAEAQAREAQIELALERIRARTMAMQRSDELGEVAKILFKQVRELGFKPWSAGFNIWLEGNDAYIDWVTNPSGAFMKPYTVDLTTHPFFREISDTKKRGEDFRVFEISGEPLAETYALLMSFAPEQFGATLASGITFPTRQINHYVFGRQVGLMFITFEPVPEAHDIFKRFGKVFEQTYTRFLDLQKAEAQAREAQIQLALERVRARTMAMQKSDELSETVFILFQQFKQLGENPDQATIGIINEDESVIEYWVTMYGNQTDRLYKFPIDEPNVTNKIYKAWKEQKSSLVIELSGKELYDFATFRESMGGAAYNKNEKKRVINVAFFSKGLINVQSAESRSAESIRLLERFAKVFEQTYTRFLDLQKAESQAREAQIELSLERVRAKTMAMHNSSDVGETVTAMFDEFVNLGISTNRCGILIFNDEATAEVWTARLNPEGRSTMIIGWLSLNAHDLLLSVYKAWEAKKKFYQYDLIGNNLVSYYEAINNSKFYPTQFDITTLPANEFHSDFFFPEGAVFTFTKEVVEEEHTKIIKRFAGVFGQTYRRFLDLQKAEAQAREAQIEAALERVRSKAMAMHNSADLSSAVSVVFTELRKLDINPIRSGIALLTKEDRKAILYGATSSEKGDDLSLVGWVMLEDHPVFLMQYESWLRGEDYFPVLHDELLKSYYEKLSASFSVPEMRLHEKQYGYFLMFTNGFLFCWSHNAYAEPEIKILKRFASVIDLTYKRYFDLQKAETQAREATIEAALERVRSRAAAMHTSKELKEVAKEMRTQLNLLGQKELETCAIHLYDGSTDHFESWAALRSPYSEGEIVQVEALFPKKGIKIIEEAIAYYLSGKKEYVLVNNGAKAIEFFEMMKACAPDAYEVVAESAKGRHEDEIWAYWSVADFPGGSLVMTTMVSPDEDSRALLKRFANVFGLAYRRFSDLQKAEAQTLEATIEAALEKVRGKAMAMHNSNDLSSAASMVFTELRKLGIHPIRCGVGVLNKESRKAQLYSASLSADGDHLSLIGWVILTGHSVMENIYDAWLKNEDYFPELSGDQLRNYYELLLNGLPVEVPDSQGGQKQYGTFLSFSVGCLYAWSEAPYNDTEIKILKRFASIIDLTFRRYMELQKSEANARESVKQAALDRVRADIASMRTISDLDRITPLIWNELTVLGIPFIRCGVFIMDDSQKLIHTFLSTPDGKAIAAFHLPYDTPGNFAEMISRWQGKQVYVDHWDEVEFISLADILVKQGAIATRDQYLNTLPHGGFYLHFLPFMQGMLYVGNTTKLHADEIRLIQSVADAFSTAYARYEDFNRLEAAKQTVEKTLTDLKQTQQQLVQSEKMASLGELTAGIAHEIQNPLNFVNNFSEVSNELIDEMNEELEKGKIEEAKAIANDIKQNLEKINHHGKRADGIVKGMLQHSRISSGQKEPTDINVLADEYLRLCYHGLRAKDKSFNATIKTEFENTIEKINIIPQDIGRVLLNLLTNAFYAVNEKKKSADGTYEPTVSVSTKKSGNQVSISVRDNGNGIPQKVVDKIFQPFFTTKPTGQGTGLGLSLSYDIVKAHGGEIKVETKEREGTEFIIRLSI